MTPLRLDTGRGLASRGAAAVALVLLLAACGDSGKKPPAAAAKPGAAVAQNPAAAAPGDAAKPAPPEWSYSSVGKRDPFRSFLAELGQTQSGLQTRCATPLGRFELEQLRLVAVVTGLEDPVAMVEAPSGVGYAVRRGAWSIFGLVSSSP